MVSVVRFFSCVCAAGLVCLSAVETRGAETALKLKYGTRIVCQGEYPGHLQGMATDGKAIYWVFTRIVVKTGINGKVAAKAKLPHHGGSPCWSGGRLYIPVCGSGFNRKLDPGAPSKNFVYVFDADLKLIEKRRIPECEYGAGGIAAHDGHFFVVGGRPAGQPGNTICEYDGDFKLLHRHEADFDSTKGIQTINFVSGKWYFGCYGTGGLTIETDENFRVLRRLRPNTVFGMIPLANGLVLVGQVSGDKVNNRRGAVARAVRFTVPAPKKKPAPKPEADKQK